MLYRLATAYAPVPTFVELGSYLGRSATWLGSAAKDRQGRLIAVDDWETAPRRPGVPADMHGAFLANLARAGLTQHVEPWRMDTRKAATRWDPAHPIGLLYVDADHSYEGVKADFELWERHLCPGGFIVFDDVPSWVGPTRLVASLPAPYEWVAAPPNQWIVHKGPADGVLDRIQADLRELGTVRLEGGNVNAPRWRRMVSKALGRLRR
jgi:MMP 1-O-methyltransferase